MSLNFKTNFKCIANKSHVFCDVGDVGNISFGRKKAIDGAKEDKAPAELIRYLESLADSDLLCFLIDFFLVDLTPLDN